MVEIRPSCVAKASSNPASRIASVGSISSPRYVPVGSLRPYRTLHARPGQQCDNRFRAWQGHHVAQEVVMINGLPGVGKTTTGVSLAAAMSVPFLSKDSIKEQLAETETDLPGPQLGVIASELMWSQAAELNGLVVVESWWYRIRDTLYAVDGLRRSGASRGVELWCTASETVIRERYRHRSRHAIHRDRERLNTDWEGWATNAGPLNITPVVEVDTSADVSIGALVEDVLSGLAASCLLAAGFTGSTA